MNPNRLREINKEDVLAIWKVAGKKFDIFPVNMKSRYVKIHTFLSRRRIEKLRTTSKYFDGDVIMLCGKYVLLNGKPTKCGLEPFKEVKTIGHESYHRTDHNRNGGIAQFEIKYYSDKDFRLRTEMHARVVELFLVYAYRGKVPLSAARKTAYSMARIYEFSDKQIEKAEGFYRRVIPIINGSSDNWVANNAIYRQWNSFKVALPIVDTMVRRGILKESPFRECDF